MDYMTMKYLKRKQLPLVLALLFTALSILLSGCSKIESGTQAQESSDPQPLKVVATTTMISDLAKTIGGDKLEVEGLMGVGIDPHLYQASAGDVTKMQNADIVIYNGIHLEGKMGEIFASLDNQNKTVICLEDGIDSGRLLDSEEEEGLHDPHIWFDVAIWKEAAVHVGETLARIDEANKEAYLDNLAAYLEELDALDTYIKDSIQTLPESQRVLITAHDAFQYFGQGYDFSVMGLQGISTDAEAGTADVMMLAQFIADNRIKAIFIESSVPPKTIEALQAAVQARGFDVQIGGELYSDSLGDAQSGHDTYISTFKANIDTIVNALK